MGIFGWIKRTKERQMLAGSERRMFEEREKKAVALREKEAQRRKVMVQEEQRLRKLRH